MHGDRRAHVGGCSGRWLAVSIVAVATFLRASIAEAQQPPPMGTARYAHAATLLPNGGVLVVGGFNGGPLSSVEVYSPYTNTWSSAAPLQTARYGHAVTVLRNGKVLVTGGCSAATFNMDSCDNNNAFARGAELYDPVANAWSPAGSLALPHTNHTATLLSNDKVLVAGGTPWQSSAELFDWQKGMWSPTGAMAVARKHHTATLLLSGKVLVTGGEPNSLTTLASRELYDPRTGTWSSIPPLAVARTHHTATLLTNGTVIIAGGNGGGPLNSVELYDDVDPTPVPVSRVTSRWIFWAIPAGLIALVGLILASRKRAVATP